MRLHNTFVVSWKIYIKNSCLLFCRFCCFHLLVSCLLAYSCIFGCIILVNIHDIFVVINVFLCKNFIIYFPKLQKLLLFKNVLLKKVGIFHLHFYNNVIGFLDNILSYLFCFPISIFSNLLQYVLLTNAWEMQLMVEIVLQIEYSFVAI
jgi:hypothetical protein